LAEEPSQLGLGHRIRLDTKAKSVPKPPLAKGEWCLRSSVTGLYSKAQGTAPSVK
jgi:hypothetical protein